MLNTEKVRTLRAKLGLTQQQAADRAGLKTRQHWNAIECGRNANVTVELLGRLAKALEVRSRDLIQD